MKHTLKRTLARWAPGAPSTGLRILLYHAIEEADPSDRLSMRVPLTMFRAQMTLLREAQYRVVPLKTILDGNRQDAPQVAITFDDGYRSQLDAAQILRELGFPATFFVVVRFLNGAFDARHAWERWGHYGWEDAATLSRWGFEIGAHSMSHASLIRCSPSRLGEEVGGAKAALEDRLQAPVVSFSYPHGMYSEAVCGAVERAGYRLACTSVSGVNRAPWQRFELRRTEISGADRLGDFQRKLQGKYDWLHPWQQWRTHHA